MTEQEHLTIIESQAKTWLKNVKATSEQIGDVLCEFMNLVEKSGAHLNGPKRREVVLYLIERYALPLLPRWLRLWGVKTAVIKVIGWIVDALVKRFHASGWANFAKKEK